MERIGIYGGAFNPPHCGHVRAAQFALQALKLDRMLVIPTGKSPHKELPPGSPTASQRMEMLRLAMPQDEKILLSDMELRKEGKSYTCETVAALRCQYPDAELVLIMGTDMFLSFHTWRSPEKIIAMASLAVLSRGDKDEESKIAQQKERLVAMGAAVTVLYNPVTAISSTQLRRMTALRCAEEFLPPEVQAYIRENGLYGVDSDLKNLPIEALQSAVVSLLNPNRVNHVLGCRQAAVSLARHWGADETDAARAALLHDITKALDGPLQLTLCRAYGIILDNFSSQNPKTLHALTGSYVAREIFGENEAVVSAICSHTTGKARMNLLEKIIYVADYMEPNRDFPGVERLRELAYSDIDKALRLGLEMTLSMLRTQNREISPESQDALQYLVETGVVL